MQSSSEQSLVEMDRCVTTLITAAKETTRKNDIFRKTQLILGGLGNLIEVSISDVTYLNLK